MKEARSRHTAALSPNGKVLIATTAGKDAGEGDAFSSAELYDQAMNGFVATGSMTAGRQAHTATLLPSGKVLLCGGYDTRGQSSASAWVYQPF